MQLPRHVVANVWTSRKRVILLPSSDSGSATSLAEKSSSSSMGVRTILLGVRGLLSCGRSSFLANFLNF